MLIEETYLNATEGHGLGESGLYEPFTEDLGELFKFLRKQYGRCVGSVYVDVEGARGVGASTPAEAIAIGWVFQRTERYEDTREPYVREVWITLHERAPDVVTTPHYRQIREVRGRA